MEKGALGVRRKLMRKSLMVGAHIAQVTAYLFLFIKPYTDA